MQDHSTRNSQENKVVQCYQRCLLLILLFPLTTRALPWSQRSREATLLYDNVHVELIDASYVNRTHKDHVTGSERYRREAVTSDDVMPSNLHFRLNLGSKEVNFRLKKSVPAINKDGKKNVADFPVFVIENGLIKRRHLLQQPNIGLYANETSGSSFVVRKTTSRSDFILEGIFYEGLDQLHLTRDAQGGLHRIHKQPRVVDFRDDYVKIFTNELDNGKFDISSREPHEAASLGKVHLIHEQRRRRKKRKRRRATPSGGNSGGVPEGTEHEVQLFMVADYKDYQTWLKYYNYNSTLTEIEMNLYYSFIANSMNVRYSSVSLVDPSFRLSIIITGLLIVNSRAVSYWTEDFTLRSGSHYVDASGALESFRHWVKAARFDLPPSDHWMLFTGFDIFTDRNPNVAGLAKLGGMCSLSSVSIIEQDNTGSVGATAAHELGHSLSALHDGEEKDCYDEDNYIMSRKLKTPDDELLASRPWQFSPCSVRAFKRFTSEVKCTQKSVRGMSVLSTSLNPGQVFSADLQCQLALGNGSYFGRSLQIREGYPSMCRRLFCAVPNEPGLYQAIFAMEKTSCGDGKWCQLGQCVTHSSAPRLRDSCPQGDDPTAPCVKEDCPYYTARTKLVYCCKTCLSAVVVSPTVSPPPLSSHLLSSAAWLGLISSEVSADTQVVRRIEAEPADTEPSGPTLGKAYPTTTAIPKGALVATTAISTQVPALSHNLSTTASTTLPSPSAPTEFTTSKIRASEITAVKLSTEDPTKGPSFTRTTATTTTTTEATATSATTKSTSIPTDIKQRGETITEYPVKPSSTESSRLTLSAAETARQYPSTQSYSAYPKSAAETTPAIPTQIPTAYISAIPNRPKSYTAYSTTSTTVHYLATSKYQKATSSNPITIPVSVPRVISTSPTSTNRSFWDSTTLSPATKTQIPLSTSTLLSTSMENKRTIPPIHAFSTVSSNNELDVPESAELHSAQSAQLGGPGGSTRWQSTTTIPPSLFTPARPSGENKNKQYNADNPATRKDSNPQTNMNIAIQTASSSFLNSLRLFSSSTTMREEPSAPSPPSSLSPLPPQLSPPSPSTSLSNSVIASSLNSLTSISSSSPSSSMNSNAPSSSLSPETALLSLVLPFSPQESSTESALSVNSFSTLTSTSPFSKPKTTTTISPFSSLYSNSLLSSPTQPSLQTNETILKTSKTTPQPRNEDGTNIDLATVSPITGFALDLPLLEINSLKHDKVSNEMRSSIFHVETLNELKKQITSQPHHNSQFNLLLKNYNTSPPSSHLLPSPYVYSSLSSSTLPTVSESVSPFISSSLSPSLKSSHLPSASLLSSPPNSPSPLTLQDVGSKDPLGGKFSTQTQSLLPNILTTRTQTTTITTTSIPKDNIHPLLLQQTQTSPMGPKSVNDLQNSINNHSSKGPKDSANYMFDEETSSNQSKYKLRDLTSQDVYEVDSNATHDVSSKNGSSSLGKPINISSNTNGNNSGQIDARHHAKHPATIPSANSISSVLNITKASVENIKFTTLKSTSNTISATDPPSLVTQTTVEPDYDILARARSLVSNTLVLSAKNIANDLNRTMKPEDKNLSSNETSGLLNATINQDLPLRNNETIGIPSKNDASLASFINRETVAKETYPTLDVVLTDPRNALSLDSPPPPTPRRNMVHLSDLTSDLKNRTSLLNIFRTQFDFLSSHQILSVTGKQEADNPRGVSFLSFLDNPVIRDSNKEISLNIDNQLKDNHGEIGSQTQNYELSQIPDLRGSKSDSTNQIKPDSQNTKDMLLPVDIDKNLRIYDASAKKHENNSSENNTVSPNDRNSLHAINKQDVATSNEHDTKRRVEQTNISNSYNVGKIPEKLVHKDRPDLSTKRISSRPIDFTGIESLNKIRNQNSFNPFFDVLINKFMHQDTFLNGNEIVPRQSDEPFLAQSLEPLDRIPKENVLAGLTHDFPTLEIDPFLNSVFGLNRNSIKHNSSLTIESLFQFLFGQTQDSPAKINWSSRKPLTTNTPSDDYQGSFSASERFPNDFSHTSSTLTSLGTKKSKPNKTKKLRPANEFFVGNNPPRRHVISSSEDAQVTGIRPDVLGNINAYARESNTEKTTRDLITIIDPNNTDRLTKTTRLSEEDGFITNITNTSHVQTTTRNVDEDLLRAILNRSHILIPLQAPMTDFLHELSLAENQFPSLEVPLPSPRSSHASSSLVSSSPLSSARFSSSSVSNSDVLSARESPSSTPIRRLRCRFQCFYYEEIPEEGERAGELGRLVQDSPTRPNRPFPITLASKQNGAEESSRVDAQHLEYIRSRLKGRSQAVAPPP